MSSCNYSIMISSTETHLIDSNVFIYRDVNANALKYKGMLNEVRPKKNLSINYFNKYSEMNKTSL
jgi:hypothetical protein